MSIVLFEAMNNVNPFLVVVLEGVTRCLVLTKPITFLIKLGGVVLTRPQASGLV